MIIPGLPQAALVLLGRSIKPLVLTAIVTNLLSWALTKYFQPHGELLDTILYAAEIGSIVVYSVGLPILATRAVARWTKTGTSPNWAAYLLMGVVALQAIAAALTPQECNSSCFLPMYPTFVGGAMIAALTLWVARPLGGSYALAAMVAIPALLWAGGHLLVDVLMATEGFSRGIGPLRPSPFGPVSIALSVIVVGSLLPVSILARCFYAGPPDPWSVGAVIHWSVWAVAWYFMTRSRAPTLPMASRLAVMASVLLLLYRMGGWIDFILD